MSKPNSFMNLLESEMRRPRQDGLTTKLAALAEELGYKFVAANRVQEKLLNQFSKRVMNANGRDFRGTSGGYIWDHYSIHIACVEMNNAYDSLQSQLSGKEAEIAEINKNCISLNLHESRVWALEEQLAKRDLEIVKLREEIEEYKAELMDKPDTTRWVLRMWNRIKCFFIGHRWFFEDTPGQVMLKITEGNDVVVVRLCKDCLKHEFVRIK